MHHQQPGVLPHPLNLQPLSLAPAAAYLLRHSPPQPSSFFAGLQPVPPAPGMVAADKRAIFSTIAKMARQICAVSEEAETTGVLSGLNYMLLQSLGGAIDQQVKLIDAPSTSTPSATLSVATASTGSSAPASPPRAVDVCKTSGKRKSKHGASEPSHATPSTTSSAAKRRRKEEAPATADSSSHTTATSDEVKKCLDCGRTKTNQWRSGPEGMSTLCNACGMRYTRRMKRQVTPAHHAANPNNNNNSDSAVIGRSVLDSPLCGHESDHGGLSPVSSPLPFNHSSPMLDEPTTPAGSHHQQEKRSNLYTLLN